MDSARLSPKKSKRFKEQIDIQNLALGPNDYEKRKLQNALEYQAEENNPFHVTPRGLLSPEPICDYLGRDLTPLSTNRMTNERSGSLDRDNSPERKRIDYLKVRIRNMVRQAAERNYDDILRQAQAK